MNKKILISSSIILGFLVITNEVKVNATSQELNGNGIVKYEMHDEETVPLDPEHPSEHISVPNNEYTSTSGYLRFDYIPKLHFGAQEISGKDQIYNVNAQLFSDERPARPNHVQITDNRANMAGWELSVKQETQFYTDDENKEELKGVVLSFDKQWANSTMDQNLAPTIVKDAIKIDQIGATYPIAKAEVGKGSGTWEIVFGSTGDIEGIESTLTPLLNAEGQPITNPVFNNNAIYKNSAIRMFVPGKSIKKATKYKTELTWTLSELT